MNDSPAPSDARGCWYTRWGLIAAIVVIAVLVGTGWHLAGANAVRERLLKAWADSIPANEELTAAALSRGAPAYKEHCASCHGAALEGDRVRGIPSLVDANWLYGSGRVSEIERIVLYGIRSGNSKGWDLASMPAFARQRPYQRYEVATLLPREIDDLTTFILSLREQQADAAAAQRGSQLFLGPERGTCWDCHGEDGKGDTAIGAPDLTDDSWVLGDGSRQSIHDAIAFGLEGSCPAWIARLEPETIRALAVYVYFAGNASAPHRSLTQVDSQHN